MQNEKNMKIKEIDPFEKQNIFHNRMIKDYKDGKIPHSSVFASYFKWKMGECSHSEITREMALKMIEEASTLLDKYYDKYPNAYNDMDVYINEDPWQQYKGFEKDKFIVSYLESIDAELTNLIVY